MPACSRNTESLHRRSARPSARQRGHAGLGLVALLIVLLIILYLVFGGPGNPGTAGTAGQVQKRTQQTAASIETRQLVTLIEHYHLTYDELPRTIADLDAPPRAFIDPWGNPLAFEFEQRPGQRTRVTIRSLGPDGVPNTDDDIYVVEDLTF